MSSLSVSTGAEVEGVLVDGVNIWLVGTVGVSSGSVQKALPSYKK